MITITETKNLFTFDELSEGSKQTAIFDLIIAWMEYKNTLRNDEWWEYIEEEDNENDN